MMRYAFLIFSFIALSCIVQAVSEVAYLFEYPYNKMIDFTLFLKRMAAITPLKWTSPFNFIQCQMIFNLVVVLVIETLSNQNKSKYFLWFAIASLFPATWAGGLSIVADLFSSHLDGEWVEEVWLAMEANFLFWCCMILFMLTKSPNNRFKRDLLTQAP